MALESVPRERRIGRALMPLGLIFLSVGVSTAVFMPFLSLFLANEVHAGPVRTTVFLTAAPITGLIASTLLAKLSDRLPIRRKLLIGAALAGFVGTLLTAFVRDYWILLGLTGTAMALAGTMFPQSFAYARQVLQRDVPEQAAFGIAALRTVFSLAWVGGPPLAALLLELGGFRYVYGVAALMYAVAALVAIFRLAEVPPAAAGEPGAGDAGREPPASRLRLAVTLAAFTLMTVPLTLSVQALPLFIERELHRDASNAGLVLGLCAALEIPLMLSLGVLASRQPLRRLLLIGGCCGIAYYALAAGTTSLGWLFAGQILNACYIAATSGLGISYVQEMLPDQPGRASTLYSNAFPIASIMAGPMFGLAQQFGYRLAYVIATVSCLAGLMLLFGYRGQRARTG